MTAGPKGPILLQDFNLIDKLAHFDRERIPERVVHAKGSGAHGVLEVTEDVTKFTKAKFLNKVSKKTPLFLRFSTVPSRFHLNIPDSGAYFERMVNSRSSDPRHPVTAKHASGSERRCPKMQKNLVKLSYSAFKLQF